MLTAKVTSKGQITIPKKIRDKMGISQGEEIQFVEENGLFYIKKGIKKSSFDKWVGYLSKQKGKGTDRIIEELRGRI
jgi:AbrB family looped-hinge helix DNA binding protein